MRMIAMTFAGDYYDICIHLQGAAVKQSTSGEVEERNYVDGKLNGKVETMKMKLNEKVKKLKMKLKTESEKTHAVTNPRTNKQTKMANIVDGGCKEILTFLFQATVIYSDSSKEQRTYKVSKK